MKLLNPSEVKQLLSAHGTKPSRRLGQNFLIDGNVLAKIIATANLSDSDVVVEVGPGIGTLTRELAGHAGKVFAIEKDSTMISILHETVRGCKNTEIIHGDILHSAPQFPAAAFKVVANIPYYLTSPLIRMLLEGPLPPTQIVLMVQKEVAQRICAAPPNMSLLSVAVQFYARPRIVSYVSKNCFWPAPKVDSAVIEIIPKEERAKIPPETFFRVAKAGFSSPRKQLINNLASALKKNKEEVLRWLAQSHIDPARRAETLSIEDWATLASTANL